VPSQMGKRFECAEHGIQYMVTKAGSGVLSCADAGDASPSLLGKRYSCGVCGATLLCTKAGTGVAICDGVPMGLVAAKALPSSD